MTNDPYRTPQIDEVVSELPPSWPRFQRWCFLVNSAVASMLILTTVGLLIMESMIARQVRIPVPGLLFVGVVTAYLIGEWIVYRRGQRIIERLLGTGNAVLMLNVALFGVMMLWNFTAAPEDTSTQLGILAWLIGSVVVGSWLGICAWYRLRRTRKVAAGEFTETGGS